MAILAENLNFSRVTLVGHSFGAEVALHVAAQRPHLVQSVIMVDGGFWPKRAVDSALHIQEKQKRLFLSPKSIPTENTDALLRSGRQLEHLRSRGTFRLRQLC